MTFPVAMSLQVGEDSMDDESGGKWLNPEFSK
jgi:hypothetical protein